MVVDADVSVEEIDEALTYLSADRLVARHAGDLDRQLALSEEIDSLLVVRSERALEGLVSSAGPEKSRVALTAPDCSQPLSPRHRPGVLGAAVEAGERP